MVVGGGGIWVVLCVVGVEVGGEIFVAVCCVEVVGRVVVWDGVVGSGTHVVVVAWGRLVGA